MQDRDWFHARHSPCCLTVFCHLSTSFALPFCGSLFQHHCRLGHTGRAHTRAATFHWRAMLAARGMLCCLCCEMTWTGAGRPSLPPPPPTISALLHLSTSCLRGFLQQLLAFYCPTHMSFWLGRRQTDRQNKAPSLWFAFTRTHTTAAQFQDSPAPHLSFSPKPPCFSPGGLEDGMVGFTT